MAKKSSEKQTAKVKGKKKSDVQLTPKQLQERLEGEIKRLVSMAKSRGYLSYEEINDLLPAEIVTPDLLDRLMEALETNDVKLMETPKKGKEKEGDEFLKEPEAAVEEEEEEKEQEEASKGNDQIGR